MASDDLVGLALPIIFTAASILLSALLVFGAFFRNPRPKSDLGAIAGSEPVPESLPTSSAAEPSSLSGCEYEVFLSFSGRDTREGFTDCLYHWLKDARVDVFRDAEELRIGEEIGPELIRGIKHSKISIPIFSKNYASSKWCLKELAFMLECRKTRNQLILPIFYDVNPNEVRHQKGSYAKAFSQHAKNYGPEQVQQWRDALAEIGALKGWELNNIANGRQGHLITKVVAKVRQELKKTHIFVTDKLVGMDDRVEEVMGLLEVEARDVRITGLWGMGGIGKTTLSKVIYNELANDFERCSFLQNIREASQRHNGLQELQGQLVADLSSHENPKFVSTDEGVNEISRRFRDIRVLIVLDDIDRKAQLEVLAAHVDWFGLGSRIIVTTRNRDILIAPLVGVTYEVREMNGEQALQLFCKHAFWKDSPAVELDAVSRDIVETTGGLPLAIEVIGSFLSGKSKSRWQATLEKLKRIPDTEVQGKLKISYEALDYRQKQVFLDIACFLIGADKRNAVYMWKDCLFYPDDTIEVLLMMSLIKIGEDDTFWMHDQLRDLGREIVRQENYEAPGKQSRLWRKEEVVDVLQRCEGTEYVRAISVEHGEIEYAFEGQNFMNLSNLRLLWLEDANLAGNFQHLLSKLRWLRCQNCSFPCPATDLQLPNLVILDLSRSKVTEEWNFWHSTQICRKLKVLDLSYCEKLTTTPEFTMFPNLERLILDNCQKLAVVHASIIHLKALSFLSLRFCSSITELPHQLGSLKALTELILQGTRIKEIPISDSMKKLEILSISSCNLLTRVPVSLGRLTSLTDLILDHSEIFELPDSIGSLLKLRRLSVNNCYFLTKLPDSIGQLKSLTQLNLQDTKIATLPDSIGNLRNLEVLRIVGSDMSCLPSALGKLNKLKVMDATRCSDLTGEIPIELGELSALEELNLGGTKISSIPETIGRASHLHTLNLEGCVLLETLPELPICLVSLGVTCKLEVPIPNLCDLINLKELVFKGCEEFVEVPRDIAKLSKLETLEFFKANIRSLPEEFGDLPQLKVLHFRWCGHLEYLPTLPSSLDRLDVVKCYALPRLPNLSNLKNLSELHLRGCDELLEIQGLGDLVSLTSFEVSSCSKIVGLCGLEKLESLRSFNISSCENLETLPDLSNLKRLSTIKAENCRKLVEVRGLDSLHALEKLNIFNCKSMEALPELSSFTLLQLLDVGGCDKLQELEGLDRLEGLYELRISRCKASEKLPSLSRLTSLGSLDLSGCEELEELGIGEMEELRELQISQCKLVKKLLDLSKLKWLRRLSIEDCGDLQELEGLDKLDALEQLEISACGSIEKLLNMSNLKSLWLLKINGCQKLQEIEGLEGMEELESLNISRCKSIEKLQNLGKLKSLQRLNINGCEKLQEIEGLEGMEELESLNISGCGSIEKLQNLGKLKSLQRLNIDGCEKLQEIEGLEGMEELESLEISGCKSIEKLQNLGKLKRLSDLFVYNCEKLQELGGLDELEGLTRLCISGCKSIKMLPDLSKLKRLTSLDVSGCDELMRIRGPEGLE